VKAALRLPAELPVICPGGHRGMFLTGDISTQIGTLSLVPQVVDSVKVPVIAAGGIADARGITAAFALGAAAVQIGTAYLLSPEATISPLYRQSASRTLWDSRGCVAISDQILPTLANSIRE